MSHAVFVRRKEAKHEEGCGRQAVCVRILLEEGSVGMWEVRLRQFQKLGILR